MNTPFRPTTALALALNLGLGLGALAGTAIAQTAPTPAQQKELDAARAELEKAAQRYGELAGKYGEAGAPIRIEKRVLRKPVIGVLLADDEAAGVRIAGVTPDSAAATGGLKSGDRITSIDGRLLKAESARGRVEEARELLAALDARKAVNVGYERDGKPQVVALTPKVGDRLLVVPDGAMFDGNVKVFTGENGEIEVTADRLRGPVFNATGDVRFRTNGDNAQVQAHRTRIHIRDPTRQVPEPAASAGRRAEWATAIAPDVRTEIIRLGSDCKGDNCKLPVLAEAFRWNGLNLAAVDAQLGRYFGTSEGVLVLSTGKDLDGLQAGDVIRKIGGKPVSHPREAMDALRAQPADAKVSVDYLRDRVTATAQVSVPKALPFSLPRAAAAPRAAGWPGAIEHRKRIFIGGDGKVQAFDDGNGKIPPAGAIKHGKPGEHRKIVIIDKDGKRREWEGDAGDTPPAWVQAMPKDGQRVEKRMKVIVDADGNKTVIDEGERLPPAAPKQD